MLGIKRRWVHHTSEFVELEGKGDGEEKQLIANRY